MRMGHERVYKKKEHTSSIEKGRQRKVRAVRKKNKDGPKKKGERRCDCTGGK